MARYIRFRSPGGTFFFTLCLAERGGTALVDHVDAFRRAYRQTLSELPVRTEAIVILPDHLHAVWSLPEHDTDFPERWRRIKARFSHEVGARERSASKWSKRERGLWQRRYWEHQVRDGADLVAHVRYCWGNPVKHGLVEKAANWPLSSIHRDIREGRVEAQWRGVMPDGAFGE